MHSYICLQAYLVLFGFLLHLLHFTDNCINHLVCGNSVERVYGTILPTALAHSLSVSHFCDSLILAVFHTLLQQKD